MSAYMFNEAVREHEIKALTRNESVRIASVSGDDRQPRFRFLTGIQIDRQ